MIALIIAGAGARIHQGTTKLLCSLRPYIKSNGVDRMFSKYVFDVSMKHQVKVLLFA